MSHSVEATANITTSAEHRWHGFMLYAITVPSFFLAGLCFQWYATTSQLALLLLGWVTFGMAFDFLSHIMGLHFGRHTRLLRGYARINFAALCFGIPFTALAGSFVLAAVAPDGISAQITRHYLPVLYSSLIFGALFLFARYRQLSIAGTVEYALDKSHGYTRIIFLLRRIFLGMALAVSITVMLDGWSSEWQLWSLLFGLSFIATVPLHIMHKQVPSMLSELITQIILFYGSWMAFVA